MKKIMFVCVSLLAYAGTTQSSTLQKSNLSPLLPVYYELKNALITGESAAVAAKAATLVGMLKSINSKTLPPADGKAFKAVRSGLQSAAEGMAASHDLAKQREYFASLSADLYTLVKATHLSADPVYRLYCPMKKAYWLSNEAAVKNPYYGKSMLDCGNLAETLQ